MLTRSKYGNVKTTIDGVVFASKREARRYCELKLLKRAGEIKNFQLQQDFVLGYDERNRAIIYRADFVITNNDGTQIIEDVKGFRTAVYILKKRLMWDRFKISVKEV